MGFSVLCLHEKWGKSQTKKKGLGGQRGERKHLLTDPRILKTLFADWLG